MSHDLKQKLESRIPGTTAHIFATHDGGDHFQALVISESFTELSLVKQHQLVLKTLKDDFEGNVHALQLKTFTPSQWETEKENYPMAN